MLDEAFTYLQKAYKPDTYEVIIVDDGSRDKTCRVALDYARKNAERGGKSIRLVRLAKNRGKGGAVRHGILHSRGERILFVDADGASRFEDLELLEKEMDEAEKLHQGRARNGDTTKEKENGNGRAEMKSFKAISLGSRAHMVKTEAVVRVCRLTV